MSAAIASVALLATARTQIADFLSTLIYVYSILIFAYIVIQMLFSSGIRPSYSLTVDRAMGFLRDVCEPYIRIFRRLLPMAGPLDLSPMFALVTLWVINVVVVQGIIHG